MAKSLQERIASARSTDRVTIETLTALIADVTAERERLAAAHIRASTESVDFILAQADRDDAAANAERYSRDVTALATVIEELDAKLAAKRESESHKAAEAERAAAIAERDVLADLFREVVPDCVSKLTALFAAVDENVERLKACRVNEPDAECVARGIKQVLGYADEPYLFRKLKIPRWNGPGRAWPQTEGFDPDYGRAQRIAAFEAMHAEEARWATYLVKPPANLRNSIPVRHRYGAIDVLRTPVRASMTEELAKLARDTGCSVEPLNGLARPGGAGAPIV